MTDKAKEKAIEYLKNNIKFGNCICAKEIKAAIDIAINKAKREVIEDIEIIDNEMRKSNDLWRIERDLIIDEVLRRLKQKHLME